MTINSLYDYVNTPNVIAKQHFVDNFDGDVLNERWATTNINGTNTFQMSDEIDEGFEIITNTATNNRATINFNNIRHYDMDNSRHIVVGRVTSTSSIVLKLGLSGDADSESISYAGWVIVNTANRLVTNDGTAQTNTALATAPNTNFHKAETDLDGTTANLWYDGILEGSATATYPTTKLQPLMFAQTLTTAAKTTQVRYFEAYNK